MKSEFLVAPRIEVIRNTASSVSDTIKFVVHSLERVTLDDALKIQSKEGYNSMGYSFQRFKSMKTTGGFITTWSCQGSCD